MNKKELTKEEIKDLKHRASEALSVARQKILINYPFIGSIAMRMDIIPVRDKRIRTACTDGNKVYFDLQFLSTLDQEQQKFVLAHEIWHAVLMHLVRRQNRDAQLFNIATDKEVNYMLQQDGFNAPPDLCFPEGEEVGKSAEEIYEMMLKNMKNQAKQNMKNKGKGGSSSGGGQSGSSGQSGGNSGGNKDGKLQGQFDGHIHNDDNSDDETQNGDQDGDGTGYGSDGSVTDKWGNVGYDSDFQPKVPKDFSDKMREAVIAEAQKMERMQGTLPAHLARLVEGYIKPEISWKEVLAQFVTQCYGGGRQWLPPNRRYVYAGMYQQSRRSQTIKIGVAIDTSGSTSGDLKKFLSELKGLVESFANYELHIIQCDAQVDKYDLYDDANPLDIDGYGFEFGGGGGTSFCPPFDYVIDNQLDIDCMVYLTDGYGPAPEKNPLDVPCLWILTKDGCEDFCDWGQKIKFKEDYDRDYGF